MKIAVIGAGSTYTPELVSCLQRERERSICVSLRCTISIPPAGDRGRLASRMLAREGFAGK